MIRNNSATSKRSGFSLVELTVVVLIMGILAAVAAPKMFDKMSQARESSSRQSLAVVRSAIELYRTETSGYPANPSTGLTQYLKGQFPKCDVAGSANNSVVIKTGTAALTVDTSSTASWIYNSDTGEFRINDASYIAW